jgi:hypothetical protein
MRINIYQCRNLSSKTTDILNPYVKVWTGIKDDPDESMAKDRPPGEET